MDFSEYTQLVTWFFENDNREKNYQNRILIPFFEELCGKFDIVDTSMLTKEWGRRNIGREKFAGIYTPDLLIASKWKLIKLEKDTTEYKALVEIKTPTALDRKHAELEIKEYLEKVKFVILTNCITWEFYMKKDNAVYTSCYSLEEQHNRVCGRYRAKIIWDDTKWAIIKQTIENLGMEKNEALLWNMYSQ